MSLKLPLNPNVELFRWGPIPGRFFYPSDFITPMFGDLVRVFGESWPPSVFLFHDGKMVWVNEDGDFRKRGKVVFVKYLLPQKTRHALRSAWQKKSKELLDFCEKIESLDARQLSLERFLSVWNSFYGLINEFWIPTIIQELGTYGAEGYLREKLVSNGLSPAELSSVMEILTAPEALSFYQEEEVELAETKDVEKHQKKYFWLKNSYAGSSVLPVSFFAERKKGLLSDQRRRENERLRMVQERKREVALRYRLSPEVIEIADTITFGIEWQDERKKYIFRTIHDKTLLLREAAHRIGMPFEVLLDHGFFEIPELLKKKTTFSGEAKKYFGFSVYDAGMTELSLAKAQKYWDLYVEERVDPSMSEFSGIVASKGAGGVVSGRVKIILDPHVSDFVKGDILAAPMTSPEYVFIMKQAAAVITDTGGLTSHAAVTSREFGIPCLVGTKIATKILKDGMMVEVDVNAGVVRILK